MKNNKEKENIPPYLITKFFSNQQLYIKTLQQNHVFYTPSIVTMMINLIELLV